MQKQLPRLDLQALHRVRDPLVARRTGVINELRAFLLERGLTTRKGREYLLSHMLEILEIVDRSLSPRMVRIVRFLWDEWKALGEQITELRNEIDQLAKQEERCRRLLSAPGVETLVAAAMVATIGNGSTFRRDATSLHGLVSYRGSNLQVVSRSYSESANEEAATCAGS